jgi:hypothetical protein
MDLNKERETLNKFLWPWSGISVSIGFAIIVILLLVGWIAYRAWFAQ